MPHLPHSIELHDSLLAFTTAAGEALCLAFRPAYVHQNGKRWRQDADLVIDTAGGNVGDAKLPGRVSDGTLKTGKGPYHNLLNLPLDDPGPVHLQLELTDGIELRLHGTSARITLHGEAVFIESFPPLGTLHRPVAFDFD